MQQGKYCFPFSICWPTHNRLDGGFLIRFHRANVRGNPCGGWAVYIVYLTHCPNRFHMVTIFSNFRNDNSHQTKKNPWLFNHPEKFTHQKHQPLRCWLISSGINSAWSIWLLKVGKDEGKGQFIRAEGWVYIMFIIHPGKLTWNIKIGQLKRKIIFQTSIFVFHVNFQGCIHPFSTFSLLSLCYFIFWASLRWQFIWSTVFFSRCAWGHQQKVLWPYNVLQLKCNNKNNVNYSDSSYSEYHSYLAFRVFESPVQNKWL